MAKPLPQSFPPVTDVAIASFPAADVASGESTIVFNAAVFSDDGTAGYYLTAESPFSNQVVVSGGPLAGDSAWAELINTDYDLLFNKPRTVKGNVYVNISIGGNGSGGGTGVPNVQISGASLIHYDGTTETTLATASSDTLVFAANDSIEAKTMNLKFDVTTPRHFAAGQTLRLTIPFWGRTTGTAGMDSYGYGVDPQDRNDPDTSQTIPDTITTKLIVNVPFRNDL